MLGALAIVTFLLELSCVLLDELLDARTCQLQLIAELGSAPVVVVHLPPPLAHSASTG